MCVCVRWCGPGRRRVCRGSEVARGLAVTVGRPEPSLERGEGLEGWKDGWD